MTDLFGFLDELANKAEEAVKSGDDYIGDNGLVHCSKCKTPKQIEINGRRFFAMCDCQARAYHAEFAAQKQRELKAKIERNRLLAFPPNSLYPTWTFDSDNGSNPTLIELAKNYVRGFDEFKAMHKGLLLFGEKGRGKSFAATCIANALIDKAYKVYMTDFPRIVNQMQSSFAARNEYIDELCSADVLIIDDFLAERDTEYMREAVFQVINTRYNTGLPLIITTNMTGNDIKAADQNVDKARIISRILEMCHPVEVKGEDQRRQKLKRDFAIVDAMLGGHILT